MKGCAISVITVALVVIATVSLYNVESEPPQSSAFRIAELHLLVDEHEKIAALWRALYENCVGADKPHQLPMPELPSPTGAAVEPVLKWDDI